MKGKAQYLEAGEEATRERSRSESLERHVTESSSFRVSLNERDFVIEFRFPSSFIITCGVL